MPKSLAEVPIRRLVEFRREHMPELRAYQEFVDQLTADDGALGHLTLVEDVRVVQTHLAAAYRTELQPKLDSLRGALNGIGVASAQEELTPRGVFERIKSSARRFAINA